MPIGQGYINLEHVELLSRAGRKTTPHGQNRKHACYVPKQLALFYRDMLYIIHLYILTFFLFLSCFFSIAIFHETTFICIGHVRYICFVFGILHNTRLRYVFGHATRIQFREPKHAQSTNPFCITQHAPNHLPVQ